jgi:hypothetical protein
MEMTSDVHIQTEQGIMPAYCGGADDTAAVARCRGDS